ncbi:copper resistance protein NlpE [Shewanella atlantica]|nr:copper resistance protein NlpE [Shewanella atlantica]
MKLQLNMWTNLPALTLLVLSATACSTQPPELEKSAETAQSSIEAAPQTVQIPLGDNSQNALDWDGTYSGVTPCASCEGIKTLLTLKRDNRYILQSEYLGRSDKTFIEQGVFEWNSNGSKITLKSEPTDKLAGKQFLVGENQLFMLDRAGNRISGALADSYRLIKITPAR